jgi:glutamine synthetase
MQDALRLFGESSFISNALGPEMQKNFVLTKNQELTEFQRRVTSLEYHTYVERL